jgi:hypothetical protein
MGGPGPAELGGEVTIGGHVYARRTHVQSSGSLTVFGSFFVEALSGIGDAHFNYDETALDLGACP